MSANTFEEVEALIVRLKAQDNREILVELHTLMSDILAHLERSKPHEMAGAMAAAMAAALADSLRSVRIEAANVNVSPTPYEIIVPQAAPVPGQSWTALKITSSRDRNGQLELTVTKH